MTGLRLHPLAPENDDEEDDNDNHDNGINGEKDTKETNDKDAGPSKIICFFQGFLHNSPFYTYVHCK